jgi:hypothetical protein
MYQTWTINWGMKQILNILFNIFSVFSITELLLCITYSKFGQYPQSGLKGHVVWRNNAKDEQQRRKACHHKRSPSSSGEVKTRAVRKTAHLTIISFCLEEGMMITNKHSKFQSNTSKGIGKKWCDMKKITKIISWKGHYFVKIHDRVMSLKWIWWSLTSI